MILVRALIDHGRLILALVGFRFRTLGQPGSLCDPFMIELSRLGDGEETLRNAGAKAFVDDPEVERHRNRISFIGLGIVKLAIHHDGNGNDAGFAGVGNLHQSERSRPLVSVLARMVLSEFLRVDWLNRTAKPDDGNRRQNDGGDSRKDDGAKPHAI